MTETRIPLRTHNNSSRMPSLLSSGTAATLRLPVRSTTNDTFNSAYQAALARKGGLAAPQFRAAYLDYTSVEIDDYDSCIGRFFVIPHVLLLHTNRLNAAVLGQVVGLFDTKGCRFVTLQTAMSYAAFRIAGALVIRYGWMWGDRWGPKLGPKVNGNLETGPPPWIPAYAKKFGTQFIS